MARETSWVAALVPRLSSHLNENKHCARYRCRSIVPPSSHSNDADASEEEEEGEGEGEDEEEDGEGEDEEDDGEDEDEDGEET